MLVEGCELSSQLSELCPALKPTFEYVARGTINHKCSKVSMVNHGAKRATKKAEMSMRGTTKIPAREFPNGLLLLWPTGFRVTLEGNCCFRGRRRVADFLN